MSSYILKNITVTIRKPHLCWGCGITVVPGFKMQYSANINDGEFQACYWCEICDAYFSKHRDNFEDGVYFGDLAYEEDYKQFKRELLMAERKVLFEKFKPSHDNRAMV